MTRAFRPIDPEALAGELAQLLHTATHGGAALRVAVDGPRCADPGAFADSLSEPLRALGRPTVAISTDLFWRDASLRLEHGRADAQSLPAWLDAAALRREVLDPLGPGGSGRYLPSLRDPVTNRATRRPAVQAAAATILLVSGELLLGLGLPFDRTIHLAVSPGARVRQTLAESGWTLEAYARYDATVAPVTAADIVIRLDDARRPAIG